MDSKKRPSPGRRYDIDWLRVLTVLLLFPVHVAVVFSPLPFYHIRNSPVSYWMLFFLAIVEPWIMPIFFVLAGWASYYSLRFRGPRHFLKERVLKILIPLIVGCVLFGPPIKYLELQSGFDGSPLDLCLRTDPTHRFGPCIPLDNSVSPPFEESFFEFWPTFFTQLDRFTWSHLWFIAYLFILSSIYLPLFLWLMKIRHNVARVNAAWVYLPMVPLLLIEIFLRPRWPGYQNLYNDWANMACYSTYLIAGFLLARHPALENALRREWKRALVIGLLGVALRVPSATGVIISPVLSYVSLVVGGWGMIIGLLGFARSRFTYTNALLKYLKEAAYPVYILHQAAVVCIGYGIVQLQAGITLKYALLLASAFAVTLAAYEFIVKRLPVLRWAFGMNPRPRREGRNKRAP